MNNKFKINEIRKQFEIETKISEYTKKVDPETYYKHLASWLEQRLEAGQHEPIVMWRSIKTDPTEKGWYLVATDDEWRRDFWCGNEWHGQGKSKYTKYWASVKPPKNT